MYQDINQAYQDFYDNDVLIKVYCLPSNMLSCYEFYSASYCDYLTFGASIFGKAWEFCFFIDALMEKTFD